MEERKYKFQKVVFKPKQIGVDIRGGYCSQVRKNSQAYKAGVRTGWRIVNIDGERVPKEDREIASLIRSCIEADDVFPIVFRLPPKDTYAGYKCGDVVEALDSTGRQWNKCLIIDIQKDKFSIVYLHNAVRSKKFQAMLRRIDADEEMDDGEDDWEEEDELEGKRKKKNGKRKKKDKDDVEIEASTKKLLKSAIGKEALADAKEMKKEYARVAAMCNDEDKCDQVFVYLEEKLSSFKHPSRVLKALLLASYLLAYGNDNLSNRVADELEDSIRSAADIDTSAKTSAGKSAVSEIQNRVGPAALQLLDDPKSLAQVRSSVKAQTQAQMSIAPPDGFNSPIHQAPSTTATRAQPSADNAFNNLNALTANTMSQHKQQPVQSQNTGIDLGALFGPDPEPAQPQVQPNYMVQANMQPTMHQVPQQQPYSNVNLLAQGMGNMSMGQPQNSTNLWSNNLVNLGGGLQQQQQPRQNQQKITMQQMQGEEVDLFSL